MTATQAAAQKELMLLWKTDAVIDLKREIADLFNDLWTYEQFYNRDPSRSSDLFVETEKKFDDIMRNMGADPAFFTEKIEELYLSRDLQDYYPLNDALKKVMALRATIPGLGR